MQIWDTAGSETFKSIVSAYYKGADAVVLVYDCSDKTSFVELQNFWIQEVKKYKEPTCQLMLLGNKSDLGDKVDEEDIKRFLSTEKIAIYSQISAKTGEKVQQAFQQLAGILMKKKPRPAASK